MLCAVKIGFLVKHNWHKALPQQGSAKKGIKLHVNNKK